MNDQNKNTIIGALYFLLSAILTGIFITQKFWLYNSVNAMMLSGCIAGGKWLIQIVAAFIFLKEKSWMFIRYVGFVCFIGSAVLLVYYILNLLPLPYGGFTQFLLSVGLSVLVMIAMYYKAVKRTGIPIKWFWGWMLCLAIAIVLQITVVFK